MLHISNFFAHFLMCCLINQTALRTLELYVVQLIVVLFYLAALTDLILYYFKLIVWNCIDEIGQNDIFCRCIIFFCIISWSFASPQVMTLIVKLRLMPRKTSILGILLTFFPINSQCFQYRLPNLWQPKQSCCNTLPSPSLSGCNGNFQWHFSVTIWRIDLMKTSHALTIFLSFR